MNTYTAKQVAEVLQNEDPQMNLRTVRVLYADWNAAAAGTGGQ
ncbi:hypothetical protein ACFSQ7_31520 [Paenibacillus rhizoplanae]